MNLEQRFFQQTAAFIRGHDLITTGDTVFVGVSGGADSLCLLELLRLYQREERFALRVVHVEHGIRGADSRADAAYVEQFCAVRDIPCQVVSVDAYTVAQKKGYSLEEAARLLRYETFEAAAAGVAQAKLAVAHHSEDQAETVLWQMVRGSALKGLGGMRARRGWLIRPLLSAHRAEIEAFLRARGIAWREDATNTDIAYTRNRLRLRVLPELEEVNAQAVQHLCEMAAHAQEAEAYLEMQAARVYAKTVQQRERTDAEQCGLVLSQTLLEYEPILQRRVLYRALHTCAGSARDIEAKHVALLQDLFSHQVGRALALPYALHAVRTYEGIALFSGDAETKAVPAALPQLVHMEVLERTADGGWTEMVTVQPAPFAKVSAALSQCCAVNFAHHRALTSLPAKCSHSCKHDSSIFAAMTELLPGISKKKYTKCFDYDKIEHHAQIRTRCSGDYLVIDAAGHRQKLKSYLVNEKIPAAERDTLPLLADGAHIMWVIGHRISEHYKVSAHTERILKVQYRGGKENE